MAGKDPAFLFYPNDYIGGTMGMTFEEKGAYIELLMLQFNRGHMTEHMIAHTVGHLWESVRDKFEQDADGRWWNRRLEEEQIKRANYTASRKNNRGGGAKNKSEKNKDIKHTHEHKRQHMSQHMEDEDVNENKDINEEKTVLNFAQFWDLYDKKVDRKRAERRWKNVREKDKPLIISHIKAYKASQPDKSLRKDPATYLYNESWHNEIITRNQNNGKKLAATIFDEAREQAFKAAGGN